MKVIPLGLTLGVALGLSLLSACTRSNLEKEPQRQPAIRTAYSEAGQKELVSIISQALHGVNVKLAKDALLRESVIIIERKQLLGIELGQVQHFELFLGNKQCFLQHRASQKHWLLQHTQCAAAP